MKLTFIFAVTLIYFKSLRYWQGSEILHFGASYLVYEIKKWLLEWIVADCRKKYSYCLVPWCQNINKKSWFVKWNKVKVYLNMGKSIRIEESQRLIINLLPWHLNIISDYWCPIENLKHIKMLDPLQWQWGSALAALDTWPCIFVNKYRLCGSLLSFFFHGKFHLNALPVDADCRVIIHFYAHFIAVENWRENDVKRSNFGKSNLSTGWGHEIFLFAHIFWIEVCAGK